MIKKIISGGQTGADMGGLKAGYAFQIPTGGLAPKRYWTENGINISLRDIYGLEESKVPGYHQRTVENIKNSDGTLLFQLVPSSGSILTRDTCVYLKKPLFEVFNLENLYEKEFIELRTWINENKIQILNIAGNRESKSPGIEAKVTAYILYLLNYMRQS